MKRRGWALVPVVAVAATVVEVAVFVAVAHAIGGGRAVLLLAALSLVGAVLLRREGVRAWRRFRAAAQAATHPGAQVSDGVVGLLGALLLAVPGFVTALLGLMLVVPPARWWARRAVAHAAERHLSTAAAGNLFGPRRVRVRRGAPVPTHNTGTPGTGTSGTGSPGLAADNDIVDGEIVDARP